MAPHQKHYKAKMRRHGWIDEAGKLVWPSDVAERQKMARGLFGIELVSRVDNRILLAEDELDDTYKAPWASLDTKASPEETRRREIFRTLNSEQREAFRELLRVTMKGELRSFCVLLDDKFGGSTITLAEPDEQIGPLELHSPRQTELKYEQFDWLKDFSIIFGQDERY